MRRLCLLLIVIGFLPALARAQALVESVPGDAIVYIGWAGEEGMGQSFKDSRFKAVLDASQVKQLFTDFLPKLSQVLGKQDPQTAEVIRLLGTLAQPMWRHPSAFYFGGVDLTDPEQPKIRAAMLCHANADTPAVLKTVQQLIAKRPTDDSQIPLAVVEQAGMVMVTVGELSTNAGPALSDQPGFKAALAQSHREPISVLYIDLEGALKQIDALIAAEAPSETKERWPVVRDALALNGFKQLISTSAIENRDWSTRMFLAAPAPRTGAAAALMDGQPLQQEILQAIPKDSTLALAGSADIARLVGEVRTIAAKIDPNYETQINAWFKSVSDRLGLDLVKDLFEPMGSDWAIYCDPNSGGAGLLGFAMVNRLDDAVRVERSLTDLSKLANESIAKKIADEDITVKFKQTQVGGVTINYFAVPFVAPAWAIADGNLYFGLYPQTVVAAVNQVSGKMPAITENEKFTSTVKNLGDQKFNMVQFVDLQARAPMGYQYLLLMSRTYLGMADFMGAQTPAFVLPSLNRILPHLSPVGAISWVDDAGYHVTGVEPFPGSVNLGTNDVSTVMIGQQALMVSILLPSLNRARETASRVKCASNQRQIGQAMLLHADSGNRQKYPNDLGTLLEKQEIGIEVFICPSTDVAIPPHIRNGTLEQQAAWVNENSSYVYLGKGFTTSTPAEQILLHEHPHNHNNDGMNLLFGDGHVEFVNQGAVPQLLEKNPKP